MTLMIFPYNLCCMKYLFPFLVVIFAGTGCAWLKDWPPGTYQQSSQSYQLPPVNSGELQVMSQGEGTWLAPAQAREQKTSTAPASPDMQRKLAALEAELAALKRDMTVAAASHNAPLPAVAAQPARPATVEAEARPQPLAGQVRPEKPVTPGTASSFAETAPLKPVPAPAAAQPLALQKEPALPVVPVRPPVVTDVSFAQKENSTIVQLNMTADSDFRYVFTVPRLLVLTLSRGVSWQADAEGKGEGAVESWQAQALPDGRVQILLSLNDIVRVERARAEAGAQGGRVLVLELAR